MTTLFRAGQALATTVALGLLSACGVPDPSTQEAVPMGNFALGTNAVVAVDPQKGPLSRNVDVDEFKAILEDEMQLRFGRYEGDRVFHMGTAIEGYVVAAPGIPLVLAPKSILIARFTLYADEVGPDGKPIKLNPETKLITVFESLASGPFIGSGYTQTPQEQMRNLSRNAAAAIQRYMLENPEWFGMSESEAERSLRAMGRRRPAEARAEAAADEAAAEAAAGAVAEGTAGAGAEAAGEG